MVRDHEMRDGRLWDRWDGRLWDEMVDDETKMRWWEMVRW